MWERAEAFNAEVLGFLADRDEPDT
jgi:hypothetical protein